MPPSRPKATEIRHWAVAKVKAKCCARFIMFSLSGHKKIICICLPSPPRLGLVWYGLAQVGIAACVTSHVRCCHMRWPWLGFPSPSFPIRLFPSNRFQVTFFEPKNCSTSQHNNFPYTIIYIHYIYPIKELWRVANPISFDIFVGECNSHSTNFICDLLLLNLTHGKSFLCCCYCCCCGVMNFDPITSTALLWLFSCPGCGCGCLQLPIVSYWKAAITMRSRACRRGKGAG